MRENLLKIINHYRVMPQLKYFQSEIFELNEAIIDFENDKRHNEELIQNDKEHIAEEIADVMVMLYQFQEYYKINETDIYEMMEYKINRQLDRISNGE